MGSPSSFGRKRPFLSLNSSASIGNLSSSERARARARANHAKNDAQKGCAMQLNGITLSVTRTLRNIDRKFGDISKRTKREIRQNSFSLLLHNTVLVLPTRGKFTHNTEVPTSLLSCHGFTALNDSPSNNLIKSLLITVPPTNAKKTLTM